MHELPQHWDSSQVAAPTRLVFTYTVWPGQDDLRSINLVSVFLFWMPLYIDAKGRKGFIRSLSFHTHGFDASEDSIELEWEELGELLVAGQLFKIVLFTSGMEWRDKGKYCIFLTSWNFICYNHWARTSEEWPCQVVHQELLADYWQTQDIGSDHWSNGRRVKYKIKRLGIPLHPWWIYQSFRSQVFKVVKHKKNKKVFCNWNSHPLLSCYPVLKIFCFWQTVKWKMMFPGPCEPHCQSVSGWEKPSKTLVCSGSILRPRH